MSIHYTDFRHKKFHFPENCLWNSGWIIRFERLSRKQYKHKGAHSCYFSKDAYAAMTKGSKYTDNKELMIIPDAVHTDLYDNLNVIPFDYIEEFIRKYI